MVIFGTGVVTGGLLVHHAQPTREHRPQRSGAVRPAQPSPAGAMRLEFLRRIESELNLAPEQRAPIERILKEGQDRTKKIMETVEPRRREEFKKTVEAFRAVLTPEQRTRLDAMMKQQQQRAREQRKAAPRPPANPALTNSPAATNS
jgi:hypothetical protein